MAEMNDDLCILSECSHDDIALDWNRAIIRLTCNHGTYTRKKQIHISNDFFSMICKIYILRVNELYTKQTCISILYNEWYVICFRYANIVYVMLTNS